MAAHRRLRAGRQQWPFTAGGETSLNCDEALVMPVRLAISHLAAQGIGRPPFMRHSLLQSPGWMWRNQSEDWLEKKVPGLRQQCQARCLFGATMSLAWGFITAVSSIHFDKGRGPQAQCKEP